MLQATEPGGNRFPSGLLYALALRSFKDRCRTYVYFARFREPHYGRSRGLTYEVLRTVSDLVGDRTIFTALIFHR